MAPDVSPLLIALWDGENEGREERVTATLDELGVEKIQRRVVLDKILPMFPAFRARRFGNPFDNVKQFKKLLTAVIDGKREFPESVDLLVDEIEAMIERSYR